MTTTTNTPTPTGLDLVIERLRRRQLALPELQVPRADDVRDEIRQALVDSVRAAVAFTRAPRSQGSHRYRLF